MRRFASPRRQDEAVLASGSELYSEPEALQQPLRCAAITVLTPHNENRGRVKKWHDPNQRSFEHRRFVLPGNDRNVMLPTWYAAGCCGGYARKSAAMHAKIDIQAIGTCYDHTMQR
jgi:hypothetical protein